MEFVDDTALDAFLASLRYPIPRSINQNEVQRIHDTIKQQQGFLNFYKGRIILTFKMIKENNNDITPEGFIAGNDGKDSSLVPDNNRLPFVASIFVKTKRGKEWRYIGDVSTVTLAYTEISNQVFGKKVCGEVSDEWVDNYYANRCNDDKSEGPFRNKYIWG